MVIPLLLVMASATPDSATVVVTRRTAVSSSDALSLCDDVSRALKAAGIAITLEPGPAARALARLGVLDTSTCQGRVQCIVEFGRQLDVEIVVSMSISESDAERSVVLQPYRVSSGAVLSTGTLLFRAGGRHSSADLNEFAARTRSVLEAARKPADPGPSTSTRPSAAAPAPNAAPPAATAPPPTAAQPELEPRRPSRLPALFVGALAASALVTAGALGVNAQLTRGRLEPVQGNHSSLTGSQADQVARSANAQFTASGVSLIVGVGLGATAVLLW